MSLKITADPTGIEIERADGPTFSIDILKSGGVEFFASDCDPDWADRRECYISISPEDASDAITAIQNWIESLTKGTSTP